MTTLHVASDDFRCHIWHIHTYVLLNPNPFQRVMDMMGTLLFRGLKDSIEILQDRIHEAGELALTHLPPEVDTRETLRDVKTTLRTSDGDIELTGIFGDSSGIVAIEITRITVVNGIKDDDIVKLQPFRFVHGGDKNAVVKVGTIAEVGLLEGVELKNVVAQLTDK